jgi:predicted PurR-regulated permease PerM
MNGILKDVEGMDWDNLKPSQLMTIFIQGQAETNKQVTTVVAELKETNKLLQKTSNNQEHIEKEVDAINVRVKSVEDSMEKKFEAVGKHMDILKSGLAVKNSQLGMARWVAALAVTTALTYFFTAYLPNKEKTDELKQIKTFLVDTMGKDKEGE